MYHSIASSGCAGEFRITIRLFTGGDISNKSVKTDKQKIRRTMGGESLESATNSTMGGESLESKFVAAIGGASLESRFDAAASSTSTNRSDDHASHAPTFAAPPEPTVEDAKEWLNYGYLQKLWEEGEYDEVGRLEIAAFNAHATPRKDRCYTNAQINDHGGKTFSIIEYEAIVNIGRSDLGNKHRNFTKLRKWINDSSPTKLFQLRDDQLIMDYVHSGKRWNGGEGLYREVFEPTGPKQLKPDSAFIIRHILFTCPGIGISKFPEVFTSFHVLLTGTAPSAGQLPSPSTIRSHCKQLGILDE